MLVEMFILYVEIVGTFAATFGVGRKGWPGAQARVLAKAPKDESENEEAMDTARLDSVQRHLRSIEVEFSL